VTNVVVSSGAVGRSSICRRRVGSRVTQVRQKRRRSAHDNAIRQHSAYGRCGQTRVTARRHAGTGSWFENVFLSRTRLTVAFVMAIMKFQPKSHQKTNAWGGSEIGSAAGSRIVTRIVRHKAAFSESGPTGATWTLVPALAYVPASGRLRVRTTNAANPARVSLSRPNTAAWKCASVNTHPQQRIVSSASGRIGAGILATANVPKKRAVERSFSMLATAERRAKAGLKKWMTAGTMKSIVTCPAGRTGQSAAPTAARANARDTALYYMAMDAKAISA